MMKVVASVYEALPLIVHRLSTLDGVASFILHRHPGRPGLLLSLYPPKGTEMREVPHLVQSHIATKWWNQVPVLSSLTWLLVTELLTM